MKRLSSFALALTMVSCFCVGTVGCTDDNVLPERTVTTIDETGGLALSPDGMLELDIPAGALSGATEISIEVRRDIELANLVSFIYELGPDGMTFDTPVQVRLFLDDGFEPSGDIVLANADGDLPALISGTEYDAATKSLHGALGHFSSYGAFDIANPCGPGSCGNPCELCVPGSDGSCGPGIAGYCDGTGGCSLAYPVCCDASTGECCDTATGNCCDPATGVACCGTDPTAPGSMCPPPYDPCAGRSCGDTCTLCAPGDASCAETAVVKYCDAAGQCAPTPPVCCDMATGNCCDTASGACCDPATGASCCTSDPSVPGTMCPPPPYDPCAGLSCGDSCTLCDPSDPGCAETAVLKYCSAAGQCLQAFPVCCDATTGNCCDAVTGACCSAGSCCVDPAGNPDPTCSGGGSGGGSTCVDPAGNPDPTCSGGSGGGSTCVDPAGNPDPTCGGGSGGGGSGCVDPAGNPDPTCSGTGSGSSGG